MSDLLCITVLGVEYVAKESPGCERCEFYSEDVEDELCGTAHYAGASCTPSTRFDGKNLIWIKKV